jgi:AcrR family transcriptional regulator
MTDETTRRYRKRKRARQEEQTRRRITEAVVELHRTVGPARTKVTEVAERAGVSRMTVYNHFPTDADLIEACSAHWTARNPFPDPTRWADLDDPAGRLRSALGELYAWYERTEDMMGNVLRDAAIVEPLDDVLDATWRPYLDGLIDTLAAGWDDGEVRAALRLAVHFQSWRLLTDSGLASEVAARVAARMVAGLAASAVAD